MPSAITIRLHFLIAAALLAVLALMPACSDDDDDDDDITGDDTANDDDTTDDDDDTTGDTDPSPPSNSPFAGEHDPDHALWMEGLDNPVEIIRDEYGIPHIYAASLDDAAFGQGFISAHDRFWQMDAMRHVGQGRLTEYMGSAALTFDLDFRAQAIDANGKQVALTWFEQMDSKVQRMLERHAAGINAYIKALKAGDYKLSQHYDNALIQSTGFTVQDIPEWTPVDTLSIGRFYLHLLSDTSADDMNNALLVASMPEDLYEDLNRLAPSQPTSVLPEFFESDAYGDGQFRRVKGAASLDPAVRMTSLRSLFSGIDWAGLIKRRTEDREQLMPLFNNAFKGSNNWVVRGEHTASGDVLVANDPHLPFMNPPIWYHHHIDTRYYGGESNPDEAGMVMGVAFAGLPAPVIGHNEFVAWGATVAYYDVVDVYVETVNETGDAVYFEGDWVPIKKVPQTFKMGPGPDAEASDQIIEFVPHHGPVEAGSKKDGKAVTVKWNGQEPGGEVDTILGWMYSKNIDEWMQATKHYVIGPMNWNAGDVHGDTGYYAHSKIPVRETLDPEHPPYMPMPGEGGYEWIGWIPDDEVPHMKNRERGYLVSANNDITGNLIDNNPLNDPQYNQRGWIEGYRAQRITDLIEEAIEDGRKLTPEDMMTIQADVRSPQIPRIMTHILGAAERQPEQVSALGLQEAVNRLAAWDMLPASGVAAEFRTDGGPDATEIAQSVAAMIYHATVNRISRFAFDDERALHGIEGNFNGTKAVLYLLENPDTSRTGQALWDNVETLDVVETSDDAILASLKDALDWLASPDGFGTADMDQWRWGEKHRVSIPDLFGLFLPLTFHPLGDFPRPGGNETVDASYNGGSIDTFTYAQGPSQRLVAQMTKDAIKSWSALPGGQVDDPDSPHYDDLLQLWLRNEAFPYYFYVEDVKEHVEEYWLLAPPSAN